MASETLHKNDEGNRNIKQLRERVVGGEHILIDSLSADELVAMQSMLFSDEAEIVNSACKPFLVAKLERVIIPP